MGGNGDGRFIAHSGTPLGSFLRQGFLESSDSALGHDFWCPGVYCSPLVDTARGYARPQVLFGDGAFHRPLLELKVDLQRLRRQRQRGGTQWVFPSSAINLRALWVHLNAPPADGEERFNSWDPALEAVPPGRHQPLAPQVSPQQQWQPQFQRENILRFSRA